MRISDWSSDVCSSDLLLQQALGDSRQKKGQLEGALQAVTASLDRTSLEAKQMRAQLSESNAQVMLFRNQAEDLRRRLEETQQLLKESQTNKTPGRRQRRSEEHTSELQSLMRISYAVFCLKKKQHKKKET